MTKSNGWRGALSSLAVIALSGCGLSDGAGALFVDPGRTASTLSSECNACIIAG